MESGVKINCGPLGIIWTESVFKNCGPVKDLFADRILSTLSAKRFESPEEICYSVSCGCCVRVPVKTREKPHVSMAGWWFLARHFFHSLRLTMSSTYQCTVHFIVRQSYMKHDGLWLQHYCPKFVQLFRLSKLSLWQQSHSLTILLKELPLAW